MLLSVGDGPGDENVCVDYSSDVPYVEDDAIKAYGTVTGMKTHQTQAAGATFVPRVSAKYIEQDTGFSKRSRRSTRCRAAMKRALRSAAGG
jgi:hypothetical protein